jgi:hypothetical protein
MKFQILILTQRARAEMLLQLLSILEQQISALGLNKFDQVDILICEDEPGSWMRWSDGSSPVQVGEKREAMRQKSQGEYICFLDDDDLIAPNYISSILPLLDGVDQVGFEVKMYSGHELQAPVYHSLKYGKWINPVNGRMGLEGAYCRDISHINPMRRELALQVPMSGGIGEDCRWAAAMRGKVKTEHYVNSALYYYLWRPNKQDAKDAMDPWRMELIDKLRVSQNSDILQ